MMGIFLKRCSNVRGKRRYTNNCIWASLHAPGKPAAETAETIRAAPERGNVAEEAPEAPDCDGNVAELELEPVGILQRSRTLEAWDLELAALVCF